MEMIIEKIKDFAATAHSGQVRKYAEEPYINHPIRVMQHCRLYVKDISIAAAALLHDVLEDTQVSNDELSTFLHGVLPKEDARHSMLLVEQLTDVYTKENYPGLNRRQRKEKEHERLASIHGHAQTIKYADVIDNSRDKAIPENDFAEKLLNEYKQLLRKIPNGHPALYKLAQEAVNNGLREMAASK